MFKPLKNNKGFTMVELTVTMVILMIVMGLAAMLILSGGSILTKDSEINAAKYIGDAVFSWVQNRARYASHMELRGGAPASGAGRQIYVSGGGHLMYNDGAETTDVFGDDFYLGNTVVVYAAKNAGGGDLLDLRVEVLDGDGGAVYSTGSTVKLVNIALESGNAITVADDATDTPLLRFDYDRSGSSGGYSDAEVNALSAVCERLADMVRRLKSAGRLSQIKAIIGSESPQNADYITAAKKEMGGSWPIPSNPSVGGSSHFVKPYFIVKDGVVSGVVYYTDSNEGTDKNASTKYIYSTRKDCWYKCTDNFTLSDSDKFASYDALMSWVENGRTSGIDKVKGTWSELQ